MIIACYNELFIVYSHMTGYHVMEATEPAQPQNDPLQVYMNVTY
jgi:hypothetical protein